MKNDFTKIVHVMGFKLKGAKLFFSYYFHNFKIKRIFQLKNSHGLVGYHVVHIMGFKLKCADNVSRIQDMT